MTENYTPIEEKIFYLMENIIYFYFKDGVLILILKEKTENK